MALKIEHYKSYIEPIINESNISECNRYSLKNPEEQNNSVINQDKVDIITLFRNIFSYMLSPSSPNEPFKPIFVDESKRSPIPSDLHGDQLKYLKELLPSISSSEVKARVADVLWSVKYGNPREYTEIAIENYIKSAETLLKESWTYTRDRLERALIVYCQIGLKGKKVRDDINIIKKIKNIIEDQHNENHAYLTVNLIRMLFDHQIYDHDKYTQILQDLALKAEKDQEYDKSRCCLWLVSKLYLKEENNECSNKCLIKVAESYVKQADLSESSKNPSYIPTSHFLQSAIEEYRNISGNNERKDEIYSRLINAQKNIKNEMQSCSATTDVTEPVNEAISKVSGKNVFDAIYNFAFLKKPPKIGYIKKAIYKMEKNYIFSSIASTIYYNSNDKVVDIESPDDSIENKMHRYVSSCRSLYMQSGVIKALECIRLEHNISLNDWTCFLKNRPFVPQERIKTFALGLYHGFHGDFVSAAHILIPQIDNSIRHILEADNIQTSKTVEGGLQEEMGLKQTLDRDETKKMLGEDIVFDLKGLLIEKSGTNLRNKMLHGLMNDAELDSADLAYLYWLTLHIIFRIKY